MHAVRTCEILSFNPGAVFALPACVDEPVVSGFCEDSGPEDPLWMLPNGPPGSIPSPASAPLAALAGGALAHRFHSWRGKSGKRHVFSVFAPAACPEFADAIIIVARQDGAGVRHIARIGESAAIQHWLSRDMRRTASLEIHVHLLADTPEARARLMADLGASAGRFSET